MPNTRTETLAADDGGTSTATVVVPDAVSGPAVLLFQEIFGVNEFLLAKAGSLAEEGYVVLCPDVFWRVQPGIALAHDEAALGEAFGHAQAYGGIDDEVRVRGESGAAAEAFVAADPYVAAGLVTSWRVRPWTVVVGAPS